MPVPLRPAAAGRTLIGRDATTGAVVCLPLESRLQGLYVLGKQGQGKTNLLLSLIAQDLLAGHGLCVLDPHGDLTTDALALVPPHREGDVVLLDLQDTAHPFAFDLLAGVDPGDPASLAAGEERVVGVFKKVWGDGSWGPRLEDLLANGVHTLLSTPGTTLAELPVLLTDAAYRARLVAAVASPVVRDYWATEYDPLRPAARAAVVAPLMNKVRAFLRHPVLSRIVSQPGASPDFAQLLAQRRVLLVRLDAGLAEATGLLGAAIVLRLLEAALGRKHLPAGSRPPFMLFADEFQLFATPSFGRLLQEARKFGVATTLAHQLRAQLTPPLQAAVKGAVNVVCFQLLADDAREMAYELVAHRQPEPPSGDLLVWALGHADPTLRAAAAQVVAAIPFVAVRADPLGPGLTDSQKHRFFEERLRRVVRAGDVKGGPFPRPYDYGTIDVERGPHGRLADGFGRLRNHLLAAHNVGPAALVTLDRGVAAAKLRGADGMRQHLLRFPQAVPPALSATVHAALREDAATPAGVPFALEPAFVEAGRRARRIRDRNRVRCQSPQPNAVGPRPEDAPPRPPAVRPLGRYEEV